jgi:hypothetical protein
VERDELRHARLALSGHRVGLLAVALFGSALAAPAGAAVFDRTTTLISAPTDTGDFNTAGAFFRFASADGSRVFFDSTQAFTLDDGDNMQLDIYERSDGVTRLLSESTDILDPGNSGVVWVGASDDGSHVFFTTTQRLAAADNDGTRIDLYERSGGLTTLLSGPTGVADPNTADIVFRGATKDGSRVFFSTTQKLTADDNDTARADLYEHANGTTTLVSQPTGVPDPNTDSVEPGNIAFSDDGGHVFFRTKERLSADDNDTARADVYERTGGVTTLVSQPAAGVVDPNIADATSVASSPSGSQVAFETNENLAMDDGDTNRGDAYIRGGGTTTLASAPTGVIDQNSDQAFFTSAPTDTGEILILTRQRMTPGDTDTFFDVYRRAGGTTSLETAATGVPDPGTADASVVHYTPDLSRFVFFTAQKLSPEDNDSDRVDLYERVGGQTVLVTRPTGVPDPDSAAPDLNSIETSRDGTHIVFETAEKLTTDDGDAGRVDVYERADGVTQLVSRATGVPDPDNFTANLGTFPWTDGTISADGSRVFFSTNQNLVPADADSNRGDVYMAVPKPPPDTSNPGGPGGPAPAPPGGGPAPGPAPGPGPVPPDRKAASFTGYRLSPTLFRAAARGASVAGRRAPTGSRVSYRLNEAATITFRVQRATKGRVVGRKCRRETRRNRRGRKRCTLYVTQRGSFAHKGKTGANAFRFTGRLRGRKLGLGSYRLSARAVDASGNASKTVTKKFKIVR